MSWRRTKFWQTKGGGGFFRRFFLYLLVFHAVILFAEASESPDRECCENPMYTFDLPPAGGPGLFTTFMPPYLRTYEPPEQPDLPEVPDVPGE